MKKKIYALMYAVLFSLLMGSVGTSQDQSDDPVIGGPSYTCIPAENYICRGCEVSDAAIGFRQGSWPNCW